MRLSGNECGIQRRRLRVRGLDLDGEAERLLAERQSPPAVATVQVEVHLHERSGFRVRCRANMAHIRQSRTDYGLDWSDSGLGLG